MENVLNNSIELNNNLEIEKEQKNFLETTLGKTINTGIDIGIRAILPDYIEEQIIDLKDNLIICCINRRGKVITPKGQDCIKKGDHVIIVTTNVGLHDLSDILRS